MDQVLQLLLVFLVSTPSISATTYYVLADDGGDDCPTGNECHPLSHYTSHSDNYFNNNTVFYFMEGNHYMNESVVIQGKSNITINGTGTSSSIITCTDHYYSGFAIDECDSITISHLSMSECGMRYISHKPSYVSSIFTSLSIYNTWRVNLYSLSIASNTDRASLMISNCMELSITNSSFTSLYGSESVTICYNSFAPHTISEPVNVNLVNCDIQGSEFGLFLSVQHGDSYLLDVTLKEISAHNSDNNIRIYITNSRFFINIDKLSSFDGSTGLILDSYQLNSSDVITLPHSVVISDSDIYNNEVGVSINLKTFTTGQSIIIQSCRIHNNYVKAIQGNNGGLVINRQYPTDITNVHIKDTIIYHNSLNVMVINYDRLTFTNISIYGATFTGLTLNDTSVIYIEGSMAIFNNTGTDGGGIALYGGSLLVLTPNAKLHIYNNTAGYRGGGIFTESYICPILAKGGLLFVNISDNTAVIGNDIYRFDARDCLVHFNSDIKQVSFPINYCICNGQIPIFSQCHVNNHFGQNFFSGQFMNFGFALFGYDYNGNKVITDGIAEIGVVDVTPSSVIHVFHKNFGNCSFVSYQMFHKYSQSDRVLAIQLKYKNHWRSFYDISFTILPCPIGFTLSSTTDICECSPVIGGDNVTCDITTIQLSRTGLMWIGTNTSSHDVTTSNYTQSCLIKEQQCFLCNNSNVTFTLNHTQYLQCNYNRSGILCGQCRDNYSLLLGSNRCELCNDNYNLTLIILFVALGIILIVFLFLLNLTVSQGTLNGLIFYANIVKLYQPILSREGAYPFFNQVLSWLNLDFGIETCFFDGMDNYSKTWLQYAFPLYLWFIVGILMIISQKSSKVAKLNLIPVLSTLFLLSYTKIVRTVVDGLHLRYVTLHCENETSSILSVWYIDPNLPYAQGKHAWLFGFSLIMLVLFCIPYTLFLLFSPVLESYCQNYRCCHFLYKFKPIFDSYNGLVKDNYRFWTGLLLVARLPPLFGVTFSNPFDNNFRLILLFLLLTIVILLLLQNIWLKGIYESRFINLLESWFLLKLMILAVIMIFIHNDGVSKIIFTCSIGIFCISFVMIAFYHLHLKLLKITCYKSIVDKISSKRWKRDNTISNFSSNILQGTHQYRGSKKVQEVPRTSYNIYRQDSLVELFDPPNDDDYYIENNHSY